MTRPAEDIARDVVDGAAKHYWVAAEQIMVGVTMGDVVELARCFARSRERFDDQRATIERLRELHRLAELHLRDTLEERAQLTRDVVAMSERLRIAETTRAAAQAVAPRETAEGDDHGEV